MYSIVKAFEQNYDKQKIEEIQQFFFFLSCDLGTSACSIFLHSLSYKKKQRLPCLISFPALPQPQFFILVARAADRQNTAFCSQQSTGA